MTQEDKKLLLTDLSARLSYGVKVRYNNKIYNIDYISALYEEVKLDIPDNYTIGISEVKPYLRPMSSMMEKEEKEFVDICTDIAKDRIHFVMDGSIDSNYMLEKFDWLNKNHFDYRGLIPKGLALEAPEGMYN